MSDRVAALLAQVDYSLGELFRARKTDRAARDVALICPVVPEGRLIQEMALISRRKLGEQERRFMMMWNALAAEDIDREHLCWILGGPVPLESTDYLGYEEAVAFGPPPRGE